MEELVIVGAGAAGLMCGALASREGIKTVILEHTDFSGKKILSTGNGKCNMTNYDLTVEKYYCKDEKFIGNILSKVDSEMLLDVFKSLGLITRDRDGYVYPYSEQASAVREVLFTACMENGVRIQNEVLIENIENADGVYFIYTNNGVIKTKSLVLATGGKTFVKSGSDGSGYGLAKKLGHKIVNTVPALTAFICHEKYYKKVSGVRVKAKIALYDKDKCVAWEYGEVQFTDYGISGIPVFNISRTGAYILKTGRKPYVLIDFMKDYSKEEIVEILSAASKNRTISEQLSFMLNKKLAMLLLELTGISKEAKIAEVSANQIGKLTDMMKGYRTDIANIKGFDYAQVTAGGVSTEEINSDTMESRLHENLYFAGEIIDVDGKCGGYNLHFAWATAMITAKAIAEKINGKNQNKPD